MSQNCTPNPVSTSIITQNTPKSPLLTLPDVPLLRILHHLPLQSLLIDFPQVHPRFPPFCSLILKRNHKQNQRLLLFIGDLERIRKFKCSFRIGIPFTDYLLDANQKHQKDPEFYRLHYVTLDEETIDKLLILMPVISNLEVIFSKVNICLISQLIRLLTRWASTLKCLKVGCEAFQAEESQHLHTLINEINLKLTVLERLTLDLDGELFLGASFQPDLFRVRREINQHYLDWPLLGRLKELKLQTRDKWNYLRILLNTLEHQAGGQLRDIGFGFPYAWDTYTNYLFNQPFDDHPLADRFTLLSTRYEPSYSLLSLSNLQGYTVHWHLNQPLNSCTSRLVSLEHLKYLELRRLSHNGSVSVDAAELSPLPTVEILRINFNNSYEFVNEDHTVLQDDAWVSLFPSVQIVNLIHLGDFCAKCYPADGNDGENPPGFEQTRQRTACLSQLLAPLTVLPSLRKIFYQRNEDLKNIAEFTRKGVFMKTHAYIY